MKTVELVVCSVSTILRMKYICMQELQNTNCISAIPRELNTLTFAFKADIVQYKYEW